MAEQEYSESGQPIYRHTEIAKNELAPAFGNEDTIGRISDHIEKTIGPIESVYHELISDLVHIDVYWVKATKSRPYHCFVTSGMSDLPMNVPEGLENFKYAELCVLLPTSWFRGEMTTQSMQEHFTDENVYWPIRWLKIMAVFPHQYGTWIGYGHTIPNGPDAEAFAPHTRLSSILLLPNMHLGERFGELKINENKTIYFYNIYPLYKEEMDYKLKHGSDALIDKMSKYQVTDILQFDRPNCCIKKGLFGLW